MKHKVSELSGALLDAAVAKAEGCSLVEYTDSGGPISFEPSVNWEQGGPIIDRERISFHCYGADVTAYVRARFAGGEATGDDGCESGATHLIAAMRAYVASKFGDEVELP